MDVPFETWRREVDVRLLSSVGMIGDDLPDADYWSMYSDGMDPEEAAAEVVENALNS